MTYDARNYVYSLEDLNSADIYITVAQNATLYL